MEELKVMVTARKELKGVVITSVSSPETIMAIAEEKGLNPQEVFVRITFQIKDDKGEAHTYPASNKLRFFGEKGYQKLLDAKKSGNPIDIALTQNEHGDIFMYLQHDKVEISSLFATPVENSDTRSNLEDLF